MMVDKTGDIRDGNKGQFPPGLRAVRLPPPALLMLIQRNSIKSVRHDRLPTEISFWKTLLAQFRKSGQ